MRGSIAAWETLLTTPERISNDTLYFIYENEQSSTEGKLYLGTKLISGTGSDSGIININDISDIYIDDTTLADKQLLVYNETTERWENASLSQIINTAVGVMSGATAATAGTSGLVPVPQAGDQDKFLKGSGQWTTINLPTFDTNVFDLNASQDITLAGFGLASIGSIPVKTNNGIEWIERSVSHLNRQITTLAKLQAQLAGEDDDPIDPDTIYMVLVNNDSSDNKYDEYMIINNRLERLGSFGQVDLNNYVTVTQFNTRVGALEDILNDQEDEQTQETIPGLVSRVTYIETNYISQADIGDLSQLLLSPGNNNLVDEVNSINDRLKWQELQNEYN